MPTSTIIPTTISPKVFSCAMEAHWENTLGNVPSPALMALWETMAKTFNAAIESDGTRWSVLQPPTGTGKTQGLSVYAALMAKANRESEQRNGILIVTRMIEQADELKEAIDRLAGFQCAAAKHSENKISLEEMQEADVLIITHAAYVLALSGLCKDDGSRWKDLVEWDHGRRRLTVIDEALANVIGEHQVNASDVRQVLSYVTPEIREQFGSQVEGLEMVKDVLETIAKKTNADQTAEGLGRFRVVWRGVHDGRITFPASLSMLPLRQAVSGLKYDHVALRKEDPLDRQRISNIVDKTLNGVEAILSTWAYCAKVGSDHTFNSSRLLIPEDLPAPVVLDATANQNFLWELLGDRVDIKPIPPNTRNYGNVTLHMARASRTGKGSMIEDGQTRIPRLLDELESTLGNDRRVFLCVHKGVEHIALNYAPKFEKYSVGHWGAVDGRNDWQDHDAVVIFGIPYPGHIWATNAFFALQGLQDDEWMKNPQWKSYADIREEMQIKQITVSIIQAINRIRCRRVIDEEGNCPPSHVFIVLPTGSRGDRILDAIKLEMPGIKIHKWSFCPDGEKVKVRKGSCHDALVSLMTSRMSGITTMSTIQKELGLNSRTAKALKATLREPDHALPVKLKEIGVSFVSSGHGRAARSYLSKA